MCGRITATFDEWANSPVAISGL